VPGGTASQATGINNSGQIVGNSTLNVGMKVEPLYGIAQHATIWNDGKATDLGTLPGGLDSYANGINNSGQVVGYSYVSFVTSFHATVWNKGVATDLGTLGGIYSFAHGINNSGQVVGYATTQTNDYRATLWDDGHAIDLNTFLTASEIGDGWVLRTATAINDHGVIVGWGDNTITGMQDAFMISPVPEPETYSMLLAGLGLIGAALRRRNASQA
jgi:probable HAF family extracellular repeat protein